MKKDGFTYVEVMIAVAVFLILFVLVMKLDIAANANLRLQGDKQNMLMEAQKQIEKYKTSKQEVGNYDTGTYQSVDGYYVIVHGQPVSNPAGILYQVTVKVRKNLSDSNSEVMLQSHMLTK